MRWIFLFVISVSSAFAQEWALVWHRDSSRCWQSLEFTNQGLGYLYGCSEGLQISRDNGYTWTVDSRWPYEGTPTSLVFYDTLQGIAVLDTDDYALTFDGGVTWTRRSTDEVPIGTPIYLDSGRLVTTVAFGLGGFGASVYISASLDSGLTWFTTYTDYDELAGDGFWSLCYSENGVLWATSLLNGLVKSTNLGVTWERAEGLPCCHPVSLASPAPGVLLVSGTTGDYPNKIAYIARTEDDGLTWETVWTDPFIHDGLSESNFIDSLHGWTATNNGRILFTSDGGRTWSRDSVFVEQFSFVQSIEFTSLTSGWILYHRHDLFLQQYTTSLFAFRDAQNDARVPQIGVPSELELTTYPNPFNSIVRIDYELPRASDARVSIYNTLGEEVATLFDGHANAGTHTLSWSPNSASGVYFVKLEAGDFVASRKVLYLR